MSNFFKDILTKMTEAFNAIEKPAEVDLHEDKTLKWRGLHNNTYAKRKSSKKVEEPVQEKSIASPEDDVSQEGKVEMEITQVKSKSNEKQDKIRKPKKTQDIPARCLRRTRSDAPEIVSEKLDPESEKPVKRRGRSKRVAVDSKTELVDINSSEIEKTPSDNLPLRTENIDNTVNSELKPLDVDNRKLRRSERNASNDRSSFLEVKVEEVKADSVQTSQETKTQIIASQNILNGVSEIEVDNSLEVGQKGKKTRRSVRLDASVDEDISISKVSNDSVKEKSDSVKEKSDSVKEKSDSVKEKPDSVKEKSIETEDSVVTLPKTDEIGSETNITVKPITIEKTPKKRGRRPRGFVPETPISNEGGVNTGSDLQTPNKKLQKTIKDSVDNNFAVTRKEKIPELPITPSQRPLRRIKPTVKILENEELRYEFETKHIARLAVSDTCSEPSGGKLKTDIKEQSNEFSAQSVKKKLFFHENNGMSVESFFPIPPQKPCPDPEKFLSEIKAAKINLHKSPEDKKLNRKQQRKLLKQKEKHFEKLGLRRNSKNDVTDDESLSSDNDEFLPSKKINVGKPNVTLRIRNNKENNLNLNYTNENLIKSCQRKRTASRLLSGPHTGKICTTDNANEHIKETSGIIKKELLGMLCLCQNISQYYTRKSPEIAFCCGIDSIEEQKVGCCNPVDGELLNLLRPSQRVGYMILCEDHKRRLRAHNCCAGCGIFCTQGQFVLCKQRHFFHAECAQKFILNSPYDPTNTTTYTSPTLVLKCPHCGFDAPEKTSMVTMKCHTLPVFLPSQKALLKPAKMSVPSSAIPQTSLKRKYQSCTEFEKLIPESVMNIISREKVVASSDFTTKDLFYSINNDDLERVAEIVASGFDIKTEMQEFLNGTCLHLVAHFGTIQMAYLLLSRDSSPEFINMVDKELRTAAICSVIGEKCDILKLFIECGANLTRKGPDGMTALHIAAKLGNISAAQIIVESVKESSNIKNFEIFLNSVDNGGWTAMVWAAEHGHTDIVSFLINLGADPNICDTENNTVLHWATLSRRIETILVLLGTKTNCSVQNINGDTPLHIACRQSLTRLCLILIANGADLMAKNKAQELPYDCIPDEESQCARAVGFNMQMRSVEPLGLRTKIVCSDISNGREAHSVQVVRCDRIIKLNGDIDDDVMLPDFKYITKSILLQNSIQIDQRVSQMRICSCNDGCNSDQCQCSTISVQNWYTLEGRLNGEFNFEDPAMIFECNDVCGCNKLVCKNRVVQNGIKFPLQVFECEQRTKGWGVRPLISVPKGSFVAEYTGEILTDLEADRRTDDSYFFDLGASEHCIDANYYGNISRFFNHACIPNIVPVRVYFDHQDFRFPKIAFFACKDIAAGEEISFDYGDKFWAVKEKYFSCQCLSPSCRYSTSQSARRLTH